MQSESQKADSMNRCRVCKCTQAEACNPPCGWERAELDLCTSCAEAIRVVREWIEGAVRPSFAALKREALNPSNPVRRQKIGRR